MSGGEAGKAIFELGNALSRSTFGRIILVLITLYGVWLTIVTLISGKSGDAGIIGMCTVVPAAFTLVGYVRARLAERRERSRRRAFGVAAIILLGLIGSVALVVVLLRRRKHAATQELSPLDPAQIDQLAREELAT